LLLIPTLSMLIIHSITTVHKVSVEAGKSISIPCLYESQYINHVKYLCEGYYWTSCSDAVKTNKPDPSGKYLISDDKKQNIFTVTINELTDKDTDYWCVVEIDNGPDHGQYFQLLVISGKCLFSCTFQIVYYFLQKNKQHVGFSQRLNVLLFVIHSLDMKSELPMNFFIEQFLKSVHFFLLFYLKALPVSMSIIRGLQDILEKT
uniref:Immunoglobulin domain-containing protein n=1 Tax=Oreochromis aureus TaxID=47969 RepID=A0AAZ1WZV6_OREAU